MIKLINYEGRKAQLRSAHFKQYGAGSPRDLSAKNSIMRGMAVPPSF